MARSRRKETTPGQGPVLRKEATGIAGLDDILGGGLPARRTTLLAGPAGAGKTLIALHFLAHGARRCNQPGVYVSFDEPVDEVVENGRSSGLDLDELIQAGRLALEHIPVDRDQFAEAGEFDLEPLFARLRRAAEKVKARRMVLDPPEVLFGAFSSRPILRGELQRLHHWMKEFGLTSITTAEPGEQSLTRTGLEDFLANCVIRLEHKMLEEVATRRLQVLKYRGSAHGTNRYPFVIHHEGISVFPITSLGLDHAAPQDYVSSGVAEIDELLGGRGFYRGSSVFVTGTAGAGKSTLAAHFVDAACARGERALYCSFEESPAQIMRNMASVGTDLRRWVDKGRLQFNAVRPGHHGYEMHLLGIQQKIADFKPSVLVGDPISSLLPMGTSRELRSMLTRLVDQVKAAEITGLFTTLVSSDDPIDDTEVGVSSLMDVWIALTFRREAGDRHHLLTVLKGRGLPHASRSCPFAITSAGLQLESVGQSGGEAEAQARDASYERAQQRLESRRKVMEARVRALQAEFEMEEAELLRSLETEVRRRERSAAGSRERPAGVKADARHRAGARRGSQR